MPMEEKVQKVIAWLEGQPPCLLVFDNVERKEDLEGLLPTDGGHHILITTRNGVAWPNNQRLDVGVMQEEEAIDLLVKIIGLDKETKKSKEDLLKKLIGNDYLGYLPLAITQAGAYIDAKSISIQEYMKEFKENQKSFWDEENSNYTKHAPVWVTFDMNFAALKEYFLALNTLKQASWLNHTAVPEDLLSSMVDVENEVARKKTWRDIKEQLKRYSLMRFDADKQQASIHPLLQEILRNKQTEEEQIAIFENVCKHMDAIVEKGQTSGLNYRAYLSHAEQLNQHGKYI